MTRPTTTGKAQDLITFTRSTTGTALAKISYGEELVTNGTFDTNTSGWTAVSSTLASVSGQLQIADAAPNSYSQAYQAVSTVAGRVYKLSVDFVGGGGGLGTITYGNTQPTSSTYGDNQVFQGATAGTYTVVFAASSATTYVSLGGEGAFTATYDNVLVKEVLYDRPDGTLQLFNHPINKPRIEYDASGNCLGLLVEEARTNKVLYSEDFTHSSWLKQELTVAPAPVAAPDGTMTATHVVKTGSNAHLVTTNVGSTADRGSIWARTVSGTGTMYLGGTDASTLVTVTEEWQKLDAQAVNTHMYAANFRGLATLTEVYVWGAQLEQGTFPTSYIPTSGSTVTRAADVASLAVSEFGYNQDQGTVVVEAKRFGTSNQFPRIAQFNDGSASNRIGVSIYGSSNTAYGSCDSGGVNQASLNEAVATGPDVYAKIGFGFGVNNFGLIVDSIIEGTDTSGSPPSNITQMQIGTRASGQYLNGHIKSIQYYPLRLSNAQLQALTS